MIGLFGETDLSIISEKECVVAFTLTLIITHKSNLNLNVTENKLNFRYIPKIKLNLLT